MPYFIVFVHIIMLPDRKDNETIPDSRFQCLPIFDDILLSAVLSLPQTLSS
jgi:hypothetical protein